MGLSLPLALSIPMDLLLLIVVGGVGAVVVLTALVGWSREALLDDDAAVRAAWAHADRTEEIVSIARCSRGRGALLELDGAGDPEPRLGLVFVLGDRTVAGPLDPRELSRVTVEADGALRLRFRDPGRAPLRLHLAEGEAWSARLRAGAARV